MPVTTVFGVKGGAGTSVVAAALAVLLVERRGAALLVDRAGDQPALLGRPEQRGPGVHDWLATDRDRSALARLELAADGGPAVLPRGDARSWSTTREADLAASLGDDPRPVVVDAGVLAPDAVGPPLVGRSVLVVRSCYLALRRATRLEARPDEVVLVREAGRALDRRDVEQVLGVPIRSVVDVDPAVARCVDAGLLAVRLPAGVRRALRRLT